MDDNSISFFNFKYSKPIVKSMKFIAYIFFLYCFMIFFTVLVAAGSVHKGFSMQMKDREDVNGCTSDYKKIESSFFNPFTVYVNPHYWFADYRVSYSSFLQNKNCAADIFAQLKIYDRYITVAVVDENSKVIFYIKHFQE